MIEEYDETIKKSKNIIQHLSKIFLKIKSKVKPIKEAEGD
jgi:hypothetical protein